MTEETFDVAVIDADSILYQIAHYQRLIVNSSIDLLEAP